jgi:hypothetical protein
MRVCAIEKPTNQGYGAQFYPRAANVESATAMELRGDATVHITQALSHQRLFEVAGAVRAAAPFGRPGAAQDVMLLS